MNMPSRVVFCTKLLTLFCAECIMRLQAYERQTQQSNKQTTKTKQDKTKPKKDNQNKQQ